MNARHIIGLTGGIASGKSTVAALLARAGFQVADADAISRQLTAPQGAALPAIRQAFGPSVFNAAGQLDRAQLGQLVFANPAHRATLEHIIHPLVQAEIHAQMAQPRTRPLVLDIPLLVESGHWLACCDRVVVVDCTQALQQQRVQQRNGWPEAQTQAVLAAQSQRHTRLQSADVVLANNGTLAALEQAVATWLRTV